MKFECTEVWGFEHAFRGMRNPKNSWDKSDSHFTILDKDCTKKNIFIIGFNDLKLAKSLISAGSEHRKFLRQIFVSVDITAPLYWWKEMDQYRISVTTNSCSTMHKILSQPITKECFELTDYDSSLSLIDDEKLGTRVSCFIDDLEQLRQSAIIYDKNSKNETSFSKEEREEYKKLSKQYWKELIRWLPESWLQKRTITMNYENIYSILHQRKGHKLTEWKEFINWAESLPNVKVLFDI